MSGQTNGMPRAGEGQKWTPAERALWLKTMQAPDDFVLVTGLEMMKMAAGMQQTRAVAADLSDMFKYATKQLGAYQNTEPDFINAVAAAAFDANRYESLVKKLAKDLPEIKRRLDLCFSGETIDKKGLEEVSNAIAFRVVHMASVLDQRRQRVKSATPPKKH